MYPCTRMSVLCTSCALTHIHHTVKLSKLIWLNVLLLVLHRPEPHDSLISTTSVPALVQSVELAQDSLKDSGSFELITVPEDREQVEGDYQEDNDGRESTKAVEEVEGEEDMEEEEEQEQESQIDDIVITV